MMNKAAAKWALISKAKVSRETAKRIDRARRDMQMALLKADIEAAIDRLKRPALLRFVE